MKGIAPKFKPGQLWLTRDSTIVVIDGRKRAYEGNWPLLCHAQGDDGALSYTAEGFFLYPGQKHRLDLVELLKES